MIYQGCYTTSNEEVHSMQKPYFISGLLISLLFLVSTVVVAAPPEIKFLPTARTVKEDTPLIVKGLKVEDSDGNLASVILSVKQGKISIEKPAAVGPNISGNETDEVIVAGTQAQINTVLSNFTYQGNPNYFGADTLTVVATDNATPPVTTNGAMGITVTKAVVSNCDWEQTGKVFYSGDLTKNISAGSVASYSFIQYNLADKKSSFNAKSAGFGLSFRYYTDYQLEKFRKDFFPSKVKKNKAEISDIPAGCRAQTKDFLNEDSKIASRISIAPTFYVFKDKNEDDLGLQFAINVGFFNDIFTVGAGWNISGNDAGEWFILAGPSVGFSF